MRAKMRVLSVSGTETYESISMMAVCGKEPFGPQGESEDNTFARYTPSASLSMSITNPALIGKIKADDVFYVDFTKVEG